MIRALFPLLALLLCGWPSINMGGGSVALAPEYTHSARYTDDSSSVYDAGAGGGDFLQVNASNTEDWTVECWIKPDATTDAFRTAWGRRTSATDYDSQFVINTTAGDTAVNFHDGVGTPRNQWNAFSAQVTACSDCGNDGAWHHWAWTRAASTLVVDMWVDGELTTRDDTETTADTTSSDEIEFGNNDEFGEQHILILI